MICRFSHIYHRWQGRRLRCPHCHELIQYAHSPKSGQGRPHSTGLARGVGVGS
mgnify:CR=1 FL=1